MMRLPTGTVTFLFTDIEGSTALWQAHPDVMPGVIARHDALLKEIVTGHNGVVFRTVGDAVHAAFAAPIDALAASLAAQHALAEASWPEGVALRVRMAIHTGTVDLQGEEYAGHTLNRVARLVSAGHGGQILLSASSAELARQAFPSDTTLRDMGEHRLKDLVLPERIYMVQAPGLPTEFPPLRTLDLPRTNLPVRRGALLGREREMEVARALLMRDDIGLVTFTGAGGTGKTSLAITIGHELLEHFPHGVWFVPLASIADPALVPSAIMASLGIREEAGRTPMDLLNNFLHSKQVLLILDNLEQVVDAGEAIAALLGGAAGLRILVTSRIALRLGDEYELPIAPLALPDREGAQDLQSLSKYAAVQLFIARAQQVRPTFAVTSENARAVAEICARLDGLPLAIELAAARIRVLTPDALLSRLHKRLPLLRGGGQDLPARQRTMESTIAWSYDLLNEEERVLFGQLSVFSGTFSLEAAEAVCDVGDGGIDLLDGLTSMVDKSLVRQDYLGDAPRFSMLQTIREYGLARLDESGELEGFAQRHVIFYSDLARALEHDGFSLGPGSVYAKFEVEWDNFRVALDWCLGPTGDTGMAARLLAPLGQYVLFGGHGPEGRARAEALFALGSADMQDVDWAGALITIGMLALQRGDYGQGLAHLRESERILEGTGDTLHRSSILNWLAISALNAGDAARAERLFAECRDLAISLDLPWAATTALSFVAESTAAQGRLIEVDPIATEAADGFRALHDPWGMGRMQAIRAATAWLRGDYGAAHLLAADAVNLIKQVTEPYNGARATTLFGMILMDEGRFDEAETTLTESLLSWQTISNRGGMILCLSCLAAVAAGQGYMERARRLYSSEVFRGGDRVLLLDGVMSVGFEHALRHIRERLGTDEQPEFPVLSVEEAVTYVVGV